jgi:hypothetical protein
MVNSLDYYSWRLIGKLTASLQVQEFSLRNIPVEDSFTSNTRFFSHNLSLKFKITNRSPMNRSIP